MTIGEQDNQIESLGSDWDKIDDLLSQIARLSNSEIPAEEFYGRALDATLAGLAAAGGALWARDDSNGGIRGPTPSVDAPSAHPTSSRAFGRVIVQKLPADAWPAGYAGERSQLIELVLHSARSSL